jgi:hypothetical protein
LSLHLAAGAQAGDIERVLVVSIDALHPATLTADTFPITRIRGTVQQALAREE